MKKFFIALLALALVAGNAFAELSWAGYALNAVTLAAGSTEDNSDITAGNGLYGLGRIQVTATNDDGTFGAYVRTGVNTGSGGDWGYRSYAWWKPISQFSVKVGFIGDLAIHYVVNWAFHSSGAPDTVAYGGWGRAGGWSFDGEPTGALVTLAPIEGLSVKIAVPYAGYPGPEAAEIYNHIIGQVTYDIANVGQIGVTYQSGAGYREGATTPGDWEWVRKDPATSTVDVDEGEWKKSADTTGDPTKDPGKVFAQFHLTSVDKLDLNVGLKYTFAGEYGEDAAKKSVTPPIVAGFGAAYAVSDTFGVKACFHADFAGSSKTGSVETKDPFKLGFDLLPYFDLSVCKVFVFMGVDVAIPDEGDDSTFDWFFNPYITKSAGGGTVYAGLQVYSDNSGADTIIKWAIPVGLDYSF
ncbi:MAG: hypothetical protein LBF60_10300 [Treponema sp.]|jgi:hypothetical protein|nr:hypothetical protein [Treponema sp.]